MDNYQILKEIDKMHHDANEALKQKQIDNYLKVFSDTLEYKQLNGKVIDKNKLCKDIVFYFDRIKALDTQFSRTEFSINDNTFTEKLIQKAITSTRVFIFFTKKWTVEREGIYHWRINNNTWEIEKIEIISEKTY